MLQVSKTTLNHSVFKNCQYVSRFYISSIKPSRKLAPSNGLSRLDAGLFKHPLIRNSMLIILLLLSNYKFVLSAFKYTAIYHNSSNKLLKTSSSFKADFYSMQFGKRAEFRNRCPSCLMKFVLPDNTHFKTKQSHKSARSLNHSEWKAGLKVSSIHHLDVILHYVNSKC